MAVPNRTSPLSIRLTVADRKALEAAAKRESRRLSDWCRVVLVRAAKGAKRG